jgi:hypothetical protein
VILPPASLPRLRYALTPFVLGKGILQFTALDRWPSQIAASPVLFGRSRMQVFSDNHFFDDAFLSASFLYAEDIYE